MVELLYKNILFDLDGTLIDSALGIINSFEYALSKYNIKVERKGSANFPILRYIELL